MKTAHRNKHLFFPLSILLCVVAYSAYPYFQHQGVIQSDVPIDAMQTIKWLGTALIGTLAYIFNTIVKQIKKLDEKFEKLNDEGCAAFKNQFH